MQQSRRNMIGIGCHLGLEIGVAPTEALNSLATSDVSPPLRIAGVR